MNKTVTMNTSQMTPFQQTKQSNNNANESNGINGLLDSISIMLANVKYEHLVAGISGGVVSTLALHPLDLLKVRFAVNGGQVTSRPHYSGLGNAITTILRQEGIRGFYRGVTPNCWGAGSSWGLYFLFYNTIKSHMSNGNVNKDLHAGQHILAATEAGTMTLVLTNPIWVVKTRLCLQYDNPKKIDIKNSAKSYTGMFDALRKIYKFEGIRGLYRGFVPGLFGVSHGSLQFMAYEQLKQYHVKHYGLNKDEKLGTMAYLSCASLSKLFAAVITYPYQVVRARMQDQYANYSGVMDVIRRTWRFEGPKGFYKGLLPNLLRVTPSCAITFVVYENTSHLLLDLASRSS